MKDDNCSIHNRKLNERMTSIKTFHLRPVRHLEIDHQALEDPLHSMHGYIIFIIKFHGGPASLHHACMADISLYYMQGNNKSRIVTN